MLFIVFVNSEFKTAFFNHPIRFDSNTRSTIFLIYTDVGLSRSVYSLGSDGSDCYAEPWVVTPQGLSATGSRRSEASPACTSCAKQEHVLLQHGILGVAGGCFTVLCNSFVLKYHSWLVWSD